MTPGPHGSFLEGDGRTQTGGSEVKFVAPWRLVPPGTHFRTKGSVVTSRDSTSTGTGVKNFVVEGRGGRSRTPSIPEDESRDWSS